MLVLNHPKGSRSQSFRVMGLLPHRRIHAYVYLTFAQRKSDDGKGWDQFPEKTAADSNDHIKTERAWPQQTIFQRIFSDKHSFIFVQISLPIVCMGLIDNEPALVHISTWHRTVYWRIYASLGLDEYHRKNTTGSFQVTSYMLYKQQTYILMKHRLINAEKSH